MAAKKVTGPLVVGYGEDVHPVKATPTTTLQQVLVSACTHFKVDAASHDLVLKGNVQDSSASLGRMRYPHGTRLDLVKRVVKVGAEVNIKVEVSGQGSVIAKFPNTTTIWEVLRQAELRVPSSSTAEAAAKAASAATPEAAALITKLNIIEWVTIPPPEKGNMFEITYNIPGYMQPIVVIGTQRIDNNDQLKSTTLSQVGLSAGSGVIRVSHRYTAPTTDERKRGQVMEAFASGIENANEETMKKAKLDEEVSIPSDRRVRLYLAPLGRFDPRSFEVPDEFYDVTHRDSVMYAKAIRVSAAVDQLKHKLDVSSKTKRDFRTTKIRVKLANRLYLEGEFKARETIADLRRFVASHLRKPDTEFYLYITPPRQRLDRIEDTFEKLGLLPSAVVNFAETIPTSTTAAATPTVPSASTSSASATPSSLSSPVTSTDIKTSEPSSTTTPSTTDTKTSDSTSTAGSSDPVDSKAEAPRTYEGGVYTLGGGGARAELKHTPEEEARALVKDELWQRLIILPDPSSSTTTPPSSSPSDSSVSSTTQQSAPASST